ncbi:hypothetical protein BT96DRAFT_1001752 [Gymnopus androsaceus JB14]|uniref:Uncharacterized protein n=1 Tax=Gymnopus androsaceus JB14 TaxID=1447944 RepID=A0A6A4H1C2_9AGAR|nr:hypothetical protein BT96DRAFT_1001752 [Gymnopus androsaceus JB14]
MTLGKEPKDFVAVRDLESVTRQDPGRTEGEMVKSRPLRQCGAAPHCLKYRGFGRWDAERSWKASGRGLVEGGRAMRDDDGRSSSSRRAPSFNPDPTDGADTSTGVRDSLNVPKPSSKPDPPMAPILQPAFTIHSTYQVPAEPLFQTRPTNCADTSTSATLSPAKKQRYKYLIRTFAPFRYSSHSPSSFVLSLLQTPPSSAGSPSSAVASPSTPTVVAATLSAA